jgi:hypothetical protein
MSNIKGTCRNQWVIGVLYYYIINLLYFVLILIFGLHDNT